MSKRNRNVSGSLGITIFFVLVIISSLAAGINYFLEYQAQHTSERKEASQYKNDPKEGGVIDCESVIIEDGFPAWLTCFAEAVTADADAKYTHYDIKAQQDMAKWAFAIVVLSVVTFLVSALGVYFVWHSFQATGATLRLLEEEQRAWVWVREVKNCRAKYEASKNWVLIEFVMLVENTGKSPAVHCHAVWHIDDKPESRKKFDGYSPNLVKRHVLTGEDGEIEFDIIGRSIPPQATVRIEAAQKIRLRQTDHLEARNFTAAFGEVKLFYRRQHFFDWEVDEHWFRLRKPDSGQNSVYSFTTSMPDGEWVDLEMVITQSHFRPQED